MAVPFSGNVSEYLSESYSVLMEELEEQLESPTDLLSPHSKNDILSPLINRIDYILSEYEEDLDGDDKNQIRGQVNVVLSKVLEVFYREFPEMADSIDTLFPESAQSMVVTAIYKILYLRRREVLFNFVYEYILSNKKDLVKRYNSSEMRKDLVYQVLRNDYPLKNSDYYTLVIMHDEIVRDILGDSNLGLSEIIMYTELHIEDEEVLLELSTFNDISLADVFCTSLTDSTFFDNFLDSIRSSLIDHIKALSQQ